MQDAIDVVVVGLLLFAAAAALAGSVAVGQVLSRRLLWAWAAVVSSIGVGNQPNVPLRSIAVILAGALIVANLVAALPARAAGSTSPARVLRAE